MKNSTNEKTIRRGIKEALEYLAFLRDGKGFLNEPDVFGGEKSGLLVVQDFEDDRDVAGLDEQNGPIRVVEASKLEDSIEELVEEKISI